MIIYFSERNGSYFHVGLTDIQLHLTENILEVIISIHF